MDWNYLDEVEQAPSMKAEYQFMLTQADYESAYQYLYRKSKTGIRSIRIFRGILIFFTLICVIRALSIGDVATWIFAIIVGVTFAYFIIQAPKRMAKTSVKPMMKRAKRFPEEVFGPFKLNLNDDGILIHSSLSSHTYFYKAIHDIYFDENNIFFFYDFNQAVSVISCTAFSTEAAKQDFLTAVSNRIP